eukprot:TRINITY_DN3286_c0_g1_i1.p1 TRINITY_DN3286_c0_g1~~TRINITY_DN3286_c0_g1_i1.p1  ORF type:complete len:383 (+),score=88.89 TRINITY_DN3286_c0_g1_i1:46-1149(+)
MNGTTGVVAALGCVFLCLNAYFLVASRRPPCLGEGSAVEPPAGGLAEEVHEAASATTHSASNSESRSAAITTVAPPSGSATAVTPPSGSATAAATANNASFYSSMCVLMTPYDLTSDKHESFLGVLDSLAHTITDLERTAFSYTIYVTVQWDDPATKEALPKIREHATQLRLSLRVLDVDWTGNLVRSVNFLGQQAYDDGCDYMFCAFDDTAMVTAAWTSIAVHELRQNNDVGIVGVRRVQTAHAPVHFENTDSTFFMTRKHLEIFGYVYPPTLRDYGSDVWIVNVYQPPCHVFCLIGHELDCRTSMLVGLHVQSSQHRYSSDNQWGERYAGALEEAKQKLRDALAHGIISPQQRDTCFAWVGPAGL